ncbi:MAG TPA: universal stress protein [Xanthomonadaceae bacterium]|nr:universal stress protein [Xanthomonadaceae bacterium]
MNPKPGAILVATDFSDAAALAAQRAAVLATELAATLVLVHAISAPAWSDQALGAPRVPVVAGHLRAAIEAALSEQRDRVAARTDATVEHVLVDGPLHRSLPLLVQDTGAEWLVLGAGGESAARGLLLGSTADRVLRVAPIPVLLVRTPCEGPYRRVALATDFSAGAERAALHGLRLAGKAQRLLVHVDERLYESTLAYAGASAETIEDYRRTSAIESMQQLESVAERLAAHDGEVVPVLREGRAGAALQALVDEAGIDLLVIGRHGRSRLEAALLGSTGRFATSALRCDVLVGCDEGSAPIGG